MRAGVLVDHFRLVGFHLAGPAAAKRLLQGDVIGGQADTALDERVFGGVGRAFSIEASRKLAAPVW